MPNTFFGLNIATSGLYAASVNLNVTANNAANAKTDGYSRQQATQVAKNALRVYQEYGMIGAGVKVTGIERVRDAFYDKKIHCKPDEIRRMLYKILSFQTDGRSSE